MSLGLPGLGSPTRQEPLHVIPMALALVVAAFAGGSLGLLWNSAKSENTKPIESDDKKDESEDGEASGEVPEASS